MHIAWATDGSESARGAVSLLRGVFDRETVRVSVLVVGRGLGTPISAGEHEPSRFGSMGAPVLPVAFVESDEPARQTPDLVLDDARALLEGVRSSVDYVTLYGSPPDALVQWLVEARPTVILVGSSGNGRGHRWLLGQVSTAVAFRSPISVLVMREGLSPPGHVLVGFDDSDDVAAVYPLLAAMLVPSSLVRLVAVVAHRALFPSSVRPRFVDAMLRASSDRFLARQAGVKLKVAVRELHARGLVNVETSVVTGVPAEELAREVQASSPRLLALGAAGKRGVRMFPGNVTERLLHESRCSVLIGRA